VTADLMNEEKMTSELKSELYRSLVTKTKKILTKEIDPVTRSKKLI
jgi:hypothetical protein